MEHIQDRLTKESLSQRLPTLVAPLFALFCVYKVTQIVCRLTGDPLSKVPGPLLARGTKLWLLSKIFTFQRCFAIHDAFKRYNSPIIRIAPNTVAFQDATVMQKLYGKTAVKPPYYKGFKIGGEEHCMSIGPWEPHAARRRLYNAAYSPAQLVVYQSELRDFANAVVGRIYNDGQNGKISVDLMLLAKQFMFDSVGLFGMGKRFDIVRDHPDHYLIKIVHGVTFQLGLRTNLPEWLIPIIESLPVHAIQEAIAAQPKFWALIEEYFNSSKKEIAEAGGDELPRETLVTRMLRGRTKGIPSDGEIKGEVAAHLIAGTDTTSITYGYCLYELSKNPSIQAKLYEEVKDLTDDPTVVPTIAQLNALPYLSYVTKEALRMFMATPGSLPRIVPAGGIVIGGYYLPAGTEVCAQGWTSHRVASVWGANADKFVPERWEKETQEMRDHFMPFGLTGSPRACPGHALATIGIKLLLAGLVRNFTFSADQKYTNDKSVKMIETFAIVPKGETMRFFCTPRTA